MIKFKPKSIENVALRAKDRMLGITTEGQKIGILVSADNFSGSRNYSMVLAKTVQSEILKNGIDCEILSIPSLCDNFVAMTANSNYIEIYKEQLSNLTELLLTERFYDGLVIIGKGASSVIGMLKAAMIINLPTIVLTEGPSGSFEGSTLKNLTDMVGKVATGKKNAHELNTAELYQTELTGDGCNFNTANLLNIVFEIMGIAVKDSSTTVSGSFGRTMVAEATGEAIVNLVKSRTNIKKLLNKKIISNAIIANFALGGSTQVLNCLIELSLACEIDINIDKALSLVKGVPVLVDTTKPFSDFIKNGGTYALLKELNKLVLIDGNVKLYNGQILNDVLKQTREGIFEKLRKESLIILRGNIAEKYALIKTLSIPSGIAKFAGKAVVFNSDTAAANAILSRSINKGTIIVINNSGIKSGQGGKIISETASAIEAMGISEDVIVVTDGFISDINNVMVIGNIRPESADGNILFIKDNDEIEIDFVKARIQLEINSKELALRQKKYIKEHVIIPNFVKNYLKK